MPQAAKATQRLHGCVLRERALASVSLARLIVNKRAHSPLLISCTRKAYTLSSQ